MEKFSIVYDAYTQRKFLELLDEGNFEMAVEKLEGMVRGLDPKEETQRIKVILEGYRIIFSDHSYKVSRDYDKNELDEYRKLGSSESLKERLEKYCELDNGRLENALNLLEDYEEHMGDKYRDKDFADISSDLGELKIYREIGTIEELEQLVSARKILDSI